MKLGQEYEISGLCVTQPETGAVAEGGYAAPLGERLKEYEVSTSRDGIHWSEPVAFSELLNQRGMQVILFQPVFASYVQFTGKSNHGGTGMFQVIGIEILVP
jgi:alpha-L-fucosidase